MEKQKVIFEIIQGENEVILRQPLNDREYWQVTFIEGIPIEQMVNAFFESKKRCGYLKSKETVITITDDIGHVKEYKL